MSPIFGKSEVIFESSAIFDCFIGSARQSHPGTGDSHLVSPNFLTDVNGRFPVALKFSAKFRLGSTILWGN
jgi:hypothetical protein